jgi:cbb3-type cytochrome oxidase maturation protein
VTILYMLIPLSLVLVVGAVWAFFWAVDSGQFDDLDEPAHSVLAEDGVATRAAPGPGEGDSGPGQAAGD